MSATPFEADPLPLRLDANRNDDDPLTVEAIAMDRVDSRQDAASAATFPQALAAMEENLRVLDETIMELESIWAKDGHRT